MLTTAIFPGRYVQGAGALSVLGEESKRLGARPLVVEDRYVRDNLHAALTEALHTAPEAAFEVFGGECAQSEIDRNRWGGRPPTASTCQDSGC